MPAWLHVLDPRRHFRRIVLRRPWLTFVVMGLAFFGFGAGSLNLLRLLGANAEFLLANGLMGLVDGGLRQLLGLLASGYAAMLAYVVMKSCEHTLSAWLCGSPSGGEQACARAPDGAGGPDETTETLH
ncbi:MAG: hypothetical protein ABW032_10175 [Burkholderiaceae bacterium]